MHNSIFLFLFLILFLYFNGKQGERKRMMMGMRRITC